MTQVTGNLLSQITTRIVDAIHPEKIILFGSYAWGKPDESSDVDLFIVVPRSDQPSYRRAAEVYRFIRGIGVPVDIVVQTHDEVERSKRVATSLANRVLEQGKVLYG